MTLKIKEVNNTYIIDIHSDRISDRLLVELRNYISSVGHKRRVAINLSNISYIGNDFGEFLAEHRVALLSPVLNVCILMFLMKYDRLSDLFVCEEDFFQNKRSLVKRSFRLCS